MCRNRKKKCGFLRETYSFSDHCIIAASYARIEDDVFTRPQVCRGERNSSTRVFWRTLFGEQRTRFFTPDLLENRSSSNYNIIYLRRLTFFNRSPPCAVPSPRQNEIRFDRPFRKNHGALVCPTDAKKKPFLHIHDASPPCTLVFVDSVLLTLLISFQTYYNRRRSRTVRRSRSKSLTSKRVFNFSLL